MTPKQIAEKYVRGMIPSLMELSFGCELRYAPDGVVTKDGQYFVTESKDGCIHCVTRDAQDGYYRSARFAIEDDYEIIGHPIQLHHWLRVLKEPTLTGSGLRASVATFDTKGVLKGFIFDLQTGQPSTEADYQAFNEIVGAKEI